MSNKQRKCFVMMPIKSDIERERWYRILNEIIKPAVSNFDAEITVKRVDELPGHGNWLKDIVKYTNDSDIIIADLTDLNPNVMWELGMRHGARPHGTIMISQNLSTIPSDLKNYGVIQYFEDKSNFDQFCRKIGESLSNLFSDSPKIDSPFFDFEGQNSSMGRKPKIEILLEIDGSINTLSAIQFNNPNKYPKPPSKWAEEEYKKHAIHVNEMTTISQEEFKKYHTSLSKWSEQYADTFNRNIETEWLKKVCRKIKPIVINHSEFEILDLKIDFIMPGGFIARDSLPILETVPERPPKPREGRSLINLSNISFMEHFSKTTFGSGLMTNLSSSLYNDTENEPHIKGSKVVYNIKKIRQETSEDELEPFFIYSDEAIGGVGKCELRSPQISSVDKKNIPFEVFNP